jgi:mRNA-degrading endonuclease RelE of RelBE toxin-antitoxin system
MMPEFREDLTRLSAEDRTSVAAALRRNYELLRNDRRSFFAKATQPYSIQLKGGLNSSLYSLRAGADLRLIMAVDDDPVFSRTLVTLFRAIRSDEVRRAFRLTADRIYKGRTGTNGSYR